MKNLFIISAIVLFFSSCDKCYQCTTTQTTQYIPSIGQVMPPSTTQTQFCGTNKELDAFQRAGTATSTANSGNVNVTVRTVTVCR